MKILKQLQTEGGYVCAEYHNREKCALGFVRPNSTIELLSGRWADSSDYPRRKAILKSLRLRKVRVLSPGEAAIVLAGRPRQGTIAHWYRVGDLVQNIVDRKRVRPSPSLLPTPQQEVMCAEFLRSAQVSSFKLPQLRHLLTPVGRTMRDVDIIGLTEGGHRIFAQVTHDKYADCARKIKALRKYRSLKSDMLVLFCDCDGRESQNGVRFVSLKSVFDIFTGTHTGKVWLKHLLEPLSFRGI